MDKQSLPTVAHPAARKPSPRKGRFGSLAALLAILVSLQFLISTTTYDTKRAHLPPHAEHILERCHALRTEPGPSHYFHHRTVSDRFVSGTTPILLKHARIWTGEQNGTEVVTGDIYLNKGIIQGVGQFGHLLEDTLPPVELEVIDVDGAWVTPGYDSAHYLALSTRSFSRPLLPVLSTTIHISETVLLQRFVSNLYV